MSDLRSEIKFDWPVGSKDPWAALARYIDKEIERGNLVSIEDACMVTATFTMKINGDKYHCSEPSLATLTDKLLEVLGDSGVIDELSVTQINIGKVIPGPNAVKTTPGVRISMMAMGVR
jgi:hypothetical protein